MALTLMYITNDPAVALIAEKNGVDRIWVDLETIGKEERQKNLNSVKSKHSIEDAAALSGVLTKSELMVRINPWFEGSAEEIEKVISAGAGRIMLPMWKSADEADRFLKAVNRRVHTTLLLETREAAECVDEVLKNPLLDEIHIGLNDLHLSYGLTFMFELLSNGTVEKLCKKMNTAGIKFGFGGISHLGDGLVPAEKIILEHYRLGSSVAILSRGFCNISKTKSIQEFEMIFEKNMKELREYESAAAGYSYGRLLENKADAAEMINEIVINIKEKA